MPKFLIRFRYIPPEDYHTPLMHIGIESTRIYAPNIESAWQVFLDSMDAHGKTWCHCSYYYKESIEEVHE